MKSINLLKFLLLLLCLQLPSMVSAYDFKVNNIAYNIVSSANKTVEVAPKTSSSAGSDGSINYSGNVVINEAVYYSGTNYTVVGIGESAFKNSFISSLKLPETLQYIKKDAFSTCFELEELSIPASVTQIGTSCFWMCPDLIRVYSYAITPPTCTGSNVFTYMAYNNATLYVPHGCLSAYQNAYGWKDFPNFQEMTPSINGHEYVDLQLPSGNLWATTNYGATSPYGYGSYVEWSSNDVVASSWGNEWCTPTINDIRELINNCQWTWTTQNGTNGYLVRGNNGNTIFLPAAGIKMGSVMKVGEWCYYWSSTPESSSMTYILLSTASSVWYGSLNTMTSLPIRPISKNGAGPVLATGITLNKSELTLEVGHTETLLATVTPSNVTNGNVTWSSSNTSIATVNSNGLVTAKAEGNSIIIAKTADGTNLNASCVVTVTSNSQETGDVNGDGLVTAADITTLYDILLNNDYSHAVYGDQTGDGIVTAADVTAVYNILLNDNPQLNNETEYTVNGVKFKMVQVEGGTFTMGGECYHDNGNSALPTHEVTLSNFFIGQTEVTQALYEAVMGDNPSYHIGNLQYPVERVSWDMCQEFIVRLNQLTGKKFRLPTEAEWEFAARGGNKSMGYTYSGSNNPDDVAWHGNNSDHMSHVVGAKLPNELGLYDMSGNVWERVADWYSPYSEEPQYCPTGPENGTMRCTRGGGYHLYGYDAEPVFYRGSNYEYDRHADMGFRICLTPDIITYTVNEVSFNMVAIEGGKFTMGATAEQGSDAESDEYPTHQVTLSGFSIGQTEVPGAVVGSDGEQPERVHR